MHTFKVGDIAIIINPKSRYYLEECVIESELKPLNEWHFQDEPVQECQGYQVSVNGDRRGWGNGRLAFRDVDLKPKPLKHTDLSTWSEVSKVCGWMPGVRV